MKEVDYRNEIGVVYCDANKCNKTLDVNSNQYSEINYEMKENGWIARKIYDNWYDRCIKKMLDLSKLEQAKSFEFIYVNTDVIVDKHFVKALRKKLNLPIDVFAFIMGVTSKTIDKWETGQKPINRTASRLMYLLDLDATLYENIYKITAINF